MPAKAFAVLNLEPYHEQAITETLEAVDAYHYQVFRDAERAMLAAAGTGDIGRFRRLYAEYDLARGFWETDRENAIAAILTRPLRRTPAGR